MSDKTYVYNETEVKMTGRSAKKELEARGRRTEAKVFTLYEVTPADNENGSWKNWVKMTDLFEIVQPEEDNNDTETP